jgi:hypothetical protein
MKKKDQDEKRTAALSLQRAVIDALIEERNYQRERWRDVCQHEEEDWLTILAVWMGKLAQESPLYQGAYDRSKFLKRLIQLAAISVAAYEGLIETKPTPETELPQPQEPLPLQPEHTAK